MVIKLIALIFGNPQKINLQSIISKCDRTNANMKQFNSILQDKPPSRGQKAGKDPSAEVIQASLLYTQTISHQLNNLVMLNLVYHHLV